MICLLTLGFTLNRAGDCGKEAPNLGFLDGCNLNANPDPAYMTGTDLVLQHLYFYSRAGCLLVLLFGLAPAKLVFTVMIGA